tara:strand:+ start:3019 stop:3399 length:381 start_codon:yes stop_codon:yes gene_type:complete
MISRYGTWGSALDEAEDTVENLSTWQALSKALTVGEFLASSLQDKYKLVLTSKQKLVNAQVSGMPVSQIQRLQANYDAAVRQYDKQREAEDSTKQYRLLGQVGGVTIIGIGAATIFFILTRALRQN